ncbi:hypothetical protein ACNF40_02960 [Cuniculiplasma sp. SKW4]|uniref:hypothetical protein n=1 Tax=Cuniculiplasma sp. SKW4 TaxID=3400171 RepID=UPI003FD4029C
MKPRCRKCGVVLNEFNTYPSYLKSHSHVCKACDSKRIKEYNRRNKEKRRLKDKEYYERNKEKIKKRVEDWKKEHKNYIMNLSDEEFAKLAFDHKK